MTRSIRGLLAGGVLAMGALPAAGQVTFAELTARRRALPIEVELEAVLAEARRAALGTALLRDGPTAAFEAGPRSTPGATRTDTTLRVDVPLQSGAGARRELHDGLDDLATRARAGVLAEAGAALAAALVSAWEAQAVAALREDDVRNVDAWLEVVERRVEAGAEPPYESALVAGERARALVEAAEARRTGAHAWGALRGMAEVPESPERLSLLGVPGDGERRGGALSRVVRDGLAARERLGLALARAQAATADSRWSLAGQVGREGVDRLARFGVAYRVPLAGERAAITAERTAAEDAARRDAERRSAELAAAVAAAAESLRAPASTIDAAQLEVAERALIVRVREGKERASAGLPLRRQLLEARVAEVRARAVRAMAGAVLFFLGEESK